MMRTRMVGVKMMTKVVCNVSLIQIQLTLNVHQKTQSPHNPRRQPQRRPTRRHLRMIHHRLQNRLQSLNNNLRQQEMKSSKVLYHRPSKTMPQLRILRPKTTQRRFLSNLQLLQSKPRLSRLLKKKRPRQPMMPRSKTMFNQFPQLCQRLNRMRTYRSKTMLQQSSRPKPQL
jgi:hypothetical protein